MENKYNKIGLGKIGIDFYKVICSEDKYFELRKGSNETENSKTFVNFFGGPYIEHGMNLKSINSSFPDENITNIEQIGDSIYITAKNRKRIW